MLKTSRGPYAVAGEEQGLAEFRVEFSMAGRLVERHLARVARLVRRGMMVEEQPTWRSGGCMGQCADDDVAVTAFQHEKKPELHLYLYYLDPTAK